MNSVYEKLYKVRTELSRVSKTTKGYNYKYANLGACHDEVDPILEAHRLLWITRPRCTDDGRAGVDYELIDLDTGDCLEGCLHLPMVDGDPQKAGSAITYARRYALAAIGLLTEEDDDGAKATKRKRANPKADAKKYITENEKAEIITAARQLADAKHPDDSEKANALFMTIGKDLVEKFDVANLGSIPAGSADKAMKLLKEMV